MSTDIKDVVKEKYGQAALRVHTGGSPAVAHPRRQMLVAIPSRRTCTKNTGQPGAGRCPESLAGMRQSDGAGAAQSRRDGA